MRDLLGTGVKHLIGNSGLSVSFEAASYIQDIWASVTNNNNN